MNILRNQRTFSNVLLQPVKYFSVNCNQKLSKTEKNFETKKRTQSLKQIFASSWEFMTNHELLEYLSANIIHADNKSGIIVINKPYGLRIKPSEETKICLESCLKDLAEVLGVKHLEVLKSASRYSSGCTILSSKKHCQDLVVNSRNRSRNDKVLFENYLAVTHGHPKRDGITEVIDVHMERIPDKQNQNDNPVIEPVLSRELMSKTKFLQSDGKSSYRVNVYLKTISRAGNGNASLVSLQPTNNRRNFLNAYMADQLSPILGDQYFSYRVKNLMGHPTKVSHLHTPGVPTPQVLPPWMLDHLGLRPGDEDMIPLHLHLFRVHLPRFLGAEKDLTVYAPPPPYFQATLKALDLRFDVEDLKTNDTIRHWKSVYPKRKNSKTVVEILDPEEPPKSPNGLRTDLLN